VSTARDIELIATTLNKYADDGKVADNIFAKNAIVRYYLEKDLEGKGGAQRIKKWDGGKEIEHTLEYGEGGNFQYYDGYDVVTMAPKEIITNSKWEWRNLFGAVVLSKVEMRKRSGKREAIVDYAETQLNNAQKTARKTINSNLLNISPGAKEPDSFSVIVAKDPTASATIGGIAQNSASNSWWRNQTKQSAASTRELLMFELLNLKNNAAYNAADDAPDLGITDQYVFEYIIQYRQNKGWVILDKKLSEIFGDEIPKVYGMTVIWDTNVPDMYTGSGSTYSSFFALNTDYLRLNFHQDAYFAIPGKPVEMIVNGQDAVSFPIITMWNVSCSNRNKQGVLHHISKSLTA
jgi:hypothetical protein